MWNLEICCRLTTGLLSCPSSLPSLFLFCSSNPLLMDIDISRHRPNLAVLWNVNIPKYLSLYEHAQLSDPTLKLKRGLTEWVLYLQLYDAAKKERLRNCECRCKYQVAPIRCVQIKLHCMHASTERVSQHSSPPCRTYCPLLYSQLNRDQYNTEKHKMKDVLTGRGRANLLCLCRKVHVGIHICNSHRKEMLMQSIDLLKSTIWRRFI